MLVFFFFSCARPASLAIDNLLRLSPLGRLVWTHPDMLTEVCDVCGTLFCGGTLRTLARPHELFVSP